MEPEKLDFEVAHDSVLFEVCIVVSCLCFMLVCVIEFWRVDDVFCVDGIDYKAAKFPESFKL